MINFIDTPETFLTRTNHEYPPGNKIVFEEFFFKKFFEEKPKTNRIYLPVQWTSFYISRNYGHNSLDDLQKFLNTLSNNEKYFTICQWDDGIINNISNLNLKTFSSGGVGDYPIPLINQSHPKVDRKRDIFASFIGVIGGRHPLRENMRNILKNNTKYLISEKTSFDNFKETMERSVFSLCPRGYGKTSFRINESLNLGAIPVYIYDEPWIPFNDLVNFETYGVLISESELKNIEIILDSISDEKIKKLQENGEKVFRDFYTYESCYNQIIKILQNEI